jgi:hypothetical protein
MPSFEEPSFEDVPLDENINTDHIPEPTNPTNHIPDLIKHIQAPANPQPRLQSKGFGTYPAAAGTQKNCSHKLKLNPDLMARFQEAKPQALNFSKGKDCSEAVKARVVPPPGLSAPPGLTSCDHMYGSKSEGAKNNASPGVDAMGYKTNSRNNAWFLKGNSTNNNMKDQDVWSSTTVATYQDLMEDSFVDSIPLSPLQGEKLAKSQLEFLEMIGNGTHAEVFLALLGSKQNAKQVEVAVKMFHPGFGAFNRGTNVLALEHKNLVKSFASVPSDSAQSFFMEYCNAGSLQKLLTTSSNKLQLVQRLKILLDVSKGMEHLHENGIVHADLKTSNILLSTKDAETPEEFSAKVSDYAFQTIRRTPGTYLAAEYGNQSWRYQAPEVFRGESTEKSDVFSFAMIIYEVFVGKVPFFDIAAPKVPGDHLVGGRRPGAEAMIPNSSVLMVGLTKRCWDQDPNRRPSFGEVSRFLENQLNLCRMYEFMKGATIIQ